MASAYIRVDASVSFQAGKRLKKIFSAAHRRDFQSKVLVFCLFMCCRFFFLFFFKSRHQHVTTFGVGKKEHHSPMLEKYYFDMHTGFSSHSIPVTLSGGVDKEFTHFYIFTVYLRRTKNSTVVVMCVRVHFCIFSNFFLLLD